MKIILTGSLGYIGKPLTKELVKKGHSVTVISSNTERQIQTKILLLGGSKSPQYLKNNLLELEKILPNAPKNTNLPDKTVFMSLWVIFFSLLDGLLCFN